MNYFIKEKRNTADIGIWKKNYMQHSCHVRKWLLQSFIMQYQAIVKKNVLNKKEIFYVNVLSTCWYV